MSALRKILYIHHFSGMGGATMSLFYIIERLDRSRYHPAVLFLGGEGPGVQYFRDHGIEVHVATNISWYAHADGARFKVISRRPLRPVTDFLRIPLSVLRVRKFLQKHSADIVHLNTSLLIPAGIAAKSLGIKVVWHNREALYRGLVGFRRFVLKNIITKCSDSIIAISQVEAERLGPSEKLQVIYNYVDFKKFDKTISPLALRKELGIHSDSFVVCNLGGVIHTKGPDVYLKAALNVLERFPSTKFILAGYPPVKKESTLIETLRRLLLKKDVSREVIRLVEEHPVLKTNVIFTGVRNDIPKILAASDVLVWSATVPHFARPIVEAWAMQKPVIATDFPNSRELIEEGITGRVFPPGNSNRLAEWIIWGIENKEQLHKMGELGYEQSVKYFNADQNARKIYEIYESLLS